MVLYLPNNTWKLASAVATGLPYRGNPVVGAVGEMADMKRHKLWKTGEDGLCCSSSAIQTLLGPSSLLEERSEIPIVSVVSFVLSATPSNWGKQPRYIDRIDMGISLKLESMPTLYRSAFLPADTTIRPTGRVAATIEVASSVVHRNEYCFRGIKNNTILPAPSN